MGIGGRTMFLLTSEGIKQIPKKKRLKALFCQHRNRVKGQSCSASGLVRISGRDIYEACQDCGKILGESHSNY